MRLSNCISEIILGALFGVGVVNRANMVSSLKISIFLFTGKIIEDSEGVTVSENLWNADIPI